MISVQAVFKIAAALYALSALLPFLSLRLSGLARFVLIPGICVNLVAVYLRYRHAWPMLPMYLSPHALPLCLALMVFLLSLLKKEALSSTVLRTALIMLTLLSFSAVLFPKDFYLPFLKSSSLFAHTFFALAVVGKGCFLVSSAYAVSVLKNPKRQGDNGACANTMVSSFFWGAVGYAVWTLSLFSGELWSYRGWGTPVVWDDATLLTTMATWFYYTCFLHLQLTKSWDMKYRAWYAAAGALVVFLYNCIPDFGPYRSLF